MERNKATLVMMMMVVMMVPAVVMMMMVAMPMPSANDDRLAGAMHALTFRFIPRLL